MSTRLVIIGGGPGGNTAATHAARLGAEVTIIERDILGGAAHLWDCIPSKTMIATGGAINFTRRIVGMGLEHVDSHLDVTAQKARVTEIEDHELAHALADAASRLGFTVGKATIEAEGQCAACTHPATETH